MAYLDLCPGRQVVVITDKTFYDGDVTVEVYDEGDAVPVCAIVLTSDEAIVLGRNIIANAISTQIHMPHHERAKVASIRKARFA